ncbi:MAG: isoaspartyl peptidase/L-asparaginase [Pseudomonadota bacterium]
MTYVLAVHGGAGVIAGDTAQEPYHAGLRAALAAGGAVLRAGGSAVAAVAAAVAALEDCPLFNAGRGAVFTADETHELDAGIMDGATLRAGALAGARHIRNPILAANAIMDDGRFVLLAGAGADRFAADAGLARVDNGYFSTPQRHAQLLGVRGLDPDSTALDHSAPEVALRDARRFGTVGAVALDAAGNLAAATSTGGMTNKRPGRIGDTPLVGAGVYANNASCAVSATGTGEHFIRACVAHDIHARMAYGGHGVARAAHDCIGGPLADLGGEGGVIALGRDGTLAMPFNSRGMYRGWLRDDAPAQTRIFREDEDRPALAP